MTFPGSTCRKPTAITTLRYGWTSSARSSRLPMPRPTPAACEGRTDAQAAGVGRGIGNLELRAELVHPYRSVVIAVGFLQVLPGKVIDLVVCLVVLAAHVLLGEQHRAWTLEVEIVLGVHARLDLARDFPRVDVLLVGAADSLRHDIWNGAVVPVW